MRRLIWITLLLELLLVGIITRSAYWSDRYSGYVAHKDLDLDLLLASGMVRIEINKLNFKHDPLFWRGPPTFERAKSTKPELIWWVFQTRFERNGLSDQTLIVMPIWPLFMVVAMPLAWMWWRHRRAPK